MVSMSTWRNEIRFAGCLRANVVAWMQPVAFHDHCGNFHVLDEVHKSRHELHGRVVLDDLTRCVKDQVGRCRGTYSLTNQALDEGFVTEDAGVVHFEEAARDALRDDHLEHTTPQYTVVGLVVVDKVTVDVVHLKVQVHGAVAAKVVEKKRQPDNSVRHQVLAHDRAGELELGGVARLNAKVKHVDVLFDDFLWSSFVQRQRCLDQTELVFKGLRLPCQFFDLDLERFCAHLSTKHMRSLVLCMYGLSRALLGGGVRRDCSGHPPVHAMATSENND
ncbi:hypothetical protein H310_09267 [Aphanomyces invadans]|uniref:Uncharacterized protein n=1 Tax=Aphanomyces invadans TaxID=157072 RepID=A0A024TUX0_9STRA|nr:hypothetical protein H310_09267 [Aphanomyces invadans]ETV97955.1 hypothetical protein H310_09267 [Aphanomyces invadans]|eukprot:XP_008873516.1 hypothetical protein H310_09267 [Aphanomyces invadans]